jgi:acetyltransferase
VEYPSHWERSAATRDGVPYRIRPIRADDENRERRFIVGLSPESRYTRMMCVMKEPSPELLYRFVHVDYDRDMAFVALVGTASDEEIIGVARYAHGLSGPECEFAVAVADAWQARGVGTTLMRTLFEYAHARGICQLHGEILAGNRRMIELAHWLGMQTHPYPQDGSLVEASAKT